MELVLDIGLMLLLPAVVIVSAVVFSILGYALFVSLTKVKLGQPPVGKLFIAYKYAYLGRSVYDDFLNSCQKNFSSCRPIKLCYGGPKASYVESAYGLILNGEAGVVDFRAKDLLCKNTFSLFMMPEISYAMSVVLPVVPWFRVTNWIAVAVGYMKIYKYAEKYNLCGYPVVEIYDLKKITLVVPLIRQDDFVVWEAQRIVYGLNQSALLRPINVFQLKSLMKKEEEEQEGIAHSPSPTPPPKPPVVKTPQITPKSPKKGKQKKRRG